MYEFSETRYSEAYGGSKVREGSGAYGGSEACGYSEAYGCPYGALALGICTLVTGSGIGNDKKGADEGPGMGEDDSNGPCMVKAFKMP